LTFPEVVEPVETGPRASPKVGHPAQTTSGTFRMIQNWIFVRKIEELCDTCEFPEGGRDGQ